jgi:isoaspartyl peptidase/L-asparaginase-like protein (Ntn-hydrolase superfamily)
MKRRITRRRFFNQSLGLGAGALLFKDLPAFTGGQPVQVPLIITSHANATGKKAMAAGWEVIAGGGAAVDAVEKAANIIEEDPNDMSVGYGKIPLLGGPHRHGADRSCLDGGP